MVRAAIHVDDCAPYMDGEHAKEDPELAKECNSWLGPNQPGINQPDPSESGRKAASPEGSVEARRSAKAEQRSGLQRLLEPLPKAAPPGAPTPNAEQPEPTLDTSAVESILDFLLAP
jgi:hypothetical protein